MEDIKNIAALLGIISTAVAGSWATIWKTISYFDKKAKEKEEKQEIKDDKLFVNQNTLLDNQTDLMDMAIRLAREADARSIQTMGQWSEARIENINEKAAWATEKQELFGRLETLENSYKATILKRDNRITALEKENTALREQVKELQARVSELEHTQQGNTDAT